MKTAGTGAEEDAGSIEIEGIRVSHPDRVLFPGQGITKRALIDYYLSVADRILPHVARRPLSLVRCPAGAGGDCFFQKHASPGFPEAFKRVRITEKSGSADYLYIEDARGLVAAAQMGVLELHVWGSHVATLEQPDRMVFDFDPDEGLDFAIVREAGGAMRERLAAAGLQSFLLASGGKGIHVVVPLTPKAGWDEVKFFAEATARGMAAENPTRYLAVASKAQRQGKIFIDHLRNGRGATAIAPFSSRSRPVAPIAWPIAWSELSRLKNAHPVHVATAPEFLTRQRHDPWAGYFDIDQVLPALSGPKRVRGPA
jgi:bifunctional non-homologous end joining protein LigD